VYLGAGDRHLALLAVEHMINGPIAVTNTHTHGSANCIALSRLMDGGGKGAASNGLRWPLSANMFLVRYEIELDKQTIS
jgi:hypothetical protein